MQFQPFSLGKYDFIELLGRGGMAEVYRVNLRGAGSFQKPFAVKRIMPGHWTEAKLVERFEQEASLNSILTHPNIVQVFEFFRSDETYFLVMEFIDGWNLRELGQKTARDPRTIPVELAVYVAVEVCKGLDYAHRKCHPDTGDPLHIIHRDISPSNVMLSRDGAVKLCDFGVAKITSQVTRTDSGLLLGKAPYMSPEQAKGEHLDARSDLFSLGTVLWELLMGRKLYDGGSDIASLRLAQECRIPSASSVNPQLPLEIDRILMRVLAGDPKARHQSAAELQEELQDFQSSYCPSYTQRKASEFLLSIFGKAPLGPVITSGAQEVMPLLPNEEEALKEGFRRLSDVLHEARTTHRQPGVSRREPPSASVSLPLRKRRKRPAGEGKGMSVLTGETEGEPVFKEESPRLPAIRLRPYLQGASLLAALLLAAVIYLSADLERVTKRLADLIAGRFLASSTPGICTLTVSSAPANAEVTIDHVLRGNTPILLRQICGSAPEVAVYLSGYRIEKRTVRVDQNARAEFPLTRLRPGSLEVVSDRAARVYVDEKLAGEMKPNERFTYRLEAGMKYHFIFTDQVTGKSVLKTYSGSDGTVVRDTIEFEE